MRNPLKPYLKLRKKLVPEGECAAPVDIMAGTTILALALVIGVSIHDVIKNFTENEKTPESAQVAQSE